jgi:putative inorganic carbon (HCO3(-)) transporter
MTRRSSIGWRSLRSGIVAGTDAPAIMAPAAPVTASASADPVDGASEAGRTTLRAELRQLWRGVEWTPTYVGFLLYVFVITTYRLPLATVSIIIALGGLLFQRERLRLPSMLLWMVGFVAWAVIGYTQTIYQQAAWTQLEILLKIIVIMFVAVNALRTPAQVRFFMIFYLACFALYPLRGAIFNYHFYGESLRGRAIWLHAYANPNDLAALCLLQFSLALSLTITEHGKWTRRAILVGLGLLPLLILMTQSRGAIIALFVTMSVLVATNWRHLKSVVPPRRRKQAALAAVALVLIVSISAPDAVWGRMRGLTAATDTKRLEEVDPEGSAKQRFEIWRVAVAVVAANPMLGVGVGVYPYEHTRFAELKAGFATTAHGRRDPHSTYLRVLAETGFPGFIAFIGCILAAVIPAERVRRAARHRYPREALQILMLQMGLFAYFLAGIFGSFAYLPFTYIHLVLIVSLTLLLRQRLRGNEFGAAMPARRRG